MASRGDASAPDWPAWAGKKPKRSNAELLEILERRELSRNLRGRGVKDRQRLKNRVRRIEGNADAGEPDMAGRHRAEAEEAAADPAGSRVRKGDGVLESERKCVACGQTKPVHDFLLLNGKGKRRAQCTPCWSAASVDYKFQKFRQAIATIDSLPLPIIAETSLAASLEAGAGEAIEYLRALVARGQKALVPGKIDPRVFTTITTCSTAAAKALANLQLRLNEAVWRRDGGEDAIAGILKRVEEAEARPGGGFQEIPARPAPDA
jgi:hypothetical protein